MKLKLHFRTKLRVWWKNGSYFCGKIVDEFDDRRFKVGSSSDGSLGDVFDALRSFRPHATDELVATVEQQPLEVLKQRVLVLVEEAIHLVEHLSRVMRDSKVLESDRLVSRVHLKPMTSRDVYEKSDISGFSSFYFSTWEVFVAA